MKYAKKEADYSNALGPVAKASPSAFAKITHQAALLLEESRDVRERAVRIQVRLCGPAPGAQADGADTPTPKEGLAPALDDLLARSLLALADAIAVLDNVESTVQS